MSGKEQPAKFYSTVFRSDHDYHGHYSNSRYYGLHKRIYDLLTCGQDARILELGCGPGQFAHFLQDEGFTNYLGIDFSDVAIEMARLKSEQEFRVGDIFAFDYDNEPYDVVVLLEVLEHLNKDVELIRKIRTGAWIVLSVPTFGASSHVRIYVSAEQIIERYGSYVKFAHITAAGPYWIASGEVQ